MSDVFMPKGTGANTVADQYITHDPAPIPTATDPAQSSARVLVQQMLDQWGLGSLAGFAWDLITKDASPDEVAYQVRQTAQYRDRFAGNVQRMKDGKRPLSEAEYISNEEAYRAASRQYLGGIGDQMFGQQDFANLIAGDVSPAEWTKRLDARAQYVQSAPEDQRAFFAYNGIDDKAALAAFLDPNKAVPLIQRQLDEARLGGAATRAGLNLNAAQAGLLAAAGVSVGDASTGFTRIAAAQQLLAPLPGEGGNTISQDEALAGTLLGNAAAQEKLSRRQQARLADFQSGGQYAGGQQGLSGLGVAR
jgi:hypothetical protein